MKIWVVDDDRTICNLLRVLLSAKGHEVDTFDDPTATPILQEQGSPCAADAMLIDYFMPHMNGLDFLKVLEERGCNEIKGTKALITAHHSPELGRELAQMGVVCFTKPFKMPAIAQWLEECEQKVAAARH